jgi:hypothetical protein
MNVLRGRRGPLHACAYPSPDTAGLELKTAGRARRGRKHGFAVSLNGSTKPNPPRLLLASGKEATL